MRAAIVLFLLTVLGYAQENPMPMGLLSSKASLAMRDDVRAELGIDGDQSVRIQAEIEKLGSVPISGTATGPLAVFARLDETVRPLFTEDQWKRLGQIWVQFEGPFVLQSFVLCDELGIDEETRTKIGEIGKAYGIWWHREIAKVRKSGDLGRIQREARKQGRKMLDLLKPEQKKKFAELEGPKFRFRS